VKPATILAAALLLAGCATAAPFDYGPYLDHMPKSILVLPPLNQSPEVDAPYSFLSTITMPLCERGYYVFPVAVVDRLMKANGCPTPAEMHQVPLDKLNAVFGADAVLYLTVTDWGTKYVLISSVTTVSVSGRLVDARTGVQLWEGVGVAQQNSGQGQNSLLGMAVAAVVEQVVNTATDRAHDIAPIAAGGLVAGDARPLLVGGRSPEFAADQQKRREARATAATTTTK